MEGWFDRQRTMTHYEDGWTGHGARPSLTGEADKTVSTRPLTTTDNEGEGEPHPTEE